MKKIYITISLLFALTFTSFSQKKLNIIGGYFGQNVTNPGVVVGFEYEKYFSESLSLPLRADLGFYNFDNNHNVLIIDVSRGFRKYFDNGLFVEQSFGLGFMFSFYREEVWHENEFHEPVFITGVANRDFMPSVSFGLGYNLSKNKLSDNFIWCRPKINWKLMTNSLSSPYFGLQIGYTHTFKTLKSASDEK